VLQNRDLQVKVRVSVTFFNAARVVQGISEFTKDIQCAIAALPMRTGEAPKSAQPRHLPFHDETLAGHSIERLNLIRTARYSPRQPVAPADGLFVESGIKEGKSIVLECEGNPTEEARKIRNGLNGIVACLLVRRTVKIVEGKIVITRVGTWPTLGGLRNS
jgi:hypothetical protein